MKNYKFHRSWASGLPVSIYRPIVSTDVSPFGGIWFEGNAFIAKGKKKYLAYAPFTSLGKIVFRRELKLLREI